MAALNQIRVEGVLDSQWAAWFGDLQIENDGRQTIISGSVHRFDQAGIRKLSPE